MSLTFPLGVLKSSPDGFIITKPSSPQASNFTKNQRPVSVQFISSESRRKKNALPFLQWKLLPTPTQYHLTSEHSQTVKRVLARSKSAFPIHSDMVSGEIITRCQEARSRACEDIDCGFAFRTRGNGRACGHIQCPVDVEITRFAIHADTPIVIDTVRRIRVLLNLTDQNPLADRVQRTRRDEEHIPLLDRHATHHIEQTVILNPPPKLLL